MHTRFEALWVPGGGCLVYDECRALAERIESEILRMDAVFNRHDPASPVARLNGSRGRVKVEDEELWFLLELGEQFRKASLGYFDIAALSNRGAALQGSSGRSAGASGAAPGAAEDAAGASRELPRTEGPWAAEAPFRLIHGSHEIETRRGCILDFGAIAKGYALERVRKILDEAGVRNALLNFGGSSALGMGHHPLGPHWEVRPATPVPCENSAFLHTEQAKKAVPCENSAFLHTEQEKKTVPCENSAFLHTEQEKKTVPCENSAFLHTEQEDGRGTGRQAEAGEGITPKKAERCFRLLDSAMSVSGKNREGRDHIVNPITGRMAGAKADIVVQGRSAIICEALSTALYTAPSELHKEIIANFGGYTFTALPREARQ
ncbi:MAG: FAD:protein FMN transferase [Bacteroidales bacterium]|nr:FAD:protein FMN transferase [Bacteroidales bacterium]